MKIWINSTIMLLLLTAFVYAGNIYPVDFSQQEEKTIDLAEKEGVEFLPIKGIIILNNIKEDGSIDMKLILPDGKVWGLFPLKKLTSLNIDIDRDNDNDVALLLLETTSGKARISFKELREDVKQENPMPATTIGEKLEGTEGETAGSKVTGSVVRKTGSKAIGVLIIIGIAVVGVLIYFLFARGKTSFGSYQ